MSKECILFIVDVSFYMNQNLVEPISDEIRTKLDLAKFCLKSIMSDKILLNPSHEMGILVLNSKETSNHLGYPNITTLVPKDILGGHEADYPFLAQAGLFFKPASDAVRFTNFIAASDNAQADLLDALTLSVALMEEYIQKKKYEKRIFILTDCSCKVSEDTDSLNQLKIAYSERGYSINFICIDAEKIEGRGDHRNEQQVQNEVYFKWFEEQEFVSVFNSSDAYEIIKSFKRKKYTARSLGKTHLVLGNAYIDINVFKKTKKERIPSLKKLNRHTNNLLKQKRTYFEQAPLAEGVDPEYAQLGPEVSDSDMHAKCYFYGNRQVIVDENIENAIAYECEKGFYVICAVPQASVHHHHFLGETDIILPMPDKNPSIKSFKALVQVCLNEHKYLLAKYSRTNKSEPKLVVLIPKVKDSNSAHLFIVQSLPFYQDLREYPFNKMTKPKEEEVVLMEKLIESMPLVNEENEDLAEPEDIYNPTFQYFLANMARVAEYPEQRDQNRNVPEEILKLFQPTFDFDQHQVSTLLNQINLKFKLVKIEKKVKAQRIQLSDLLNVQTLESEMLLAKGHAKDMDDPSHGVDWADFEHLEQLNPADPLGNFKAMIKYTKADLTLKAMHLLVKFIEQLTVQIDLNAESIYNCIRTLRVACINDDEPAVFNSFYQQFKAKFEERDVWTLLKAKKVGLVTNSESASSGVTYKESVAWLSGIEVDDVNEDGGTDTATDSDDD